MSPISSLRSVFLVLAVAVLAAGCDGFETGTPPDAEDGAAPTVQFASASVGAIPSDSLVTLDVELQNPDGNEVTVQVLYAQQASSATSADLANSVERITEISFAATAGDTTITRPVEVDISDADISDGRKEAFFALQQVESDGAAQLGEQTEVTLNIGFPPVADIRAGGVGSSGTFEAIVTEISAGDTRVQDETGGIVITRRDDFASDVAVGDLVRIAGTVSSFANLLQIDSDDLSNYEVVSSGNDLPDPQTITLAEAEENFTEYESEIVRIEGLTIDPGGDNTFQSGGSAANYTVTDGDGNTLQIRIVDGSELAGDPIPTGPITFEGVLGRFFENVQLRARYEGDIIVQ